MADRFLPTTAARDPAHTRVAVLVPVKSFSAAKGRLTDVLTGHDRAELARRCATRVVTAAGDLPVFVACDHPDVAEWATALGARPLTSRVTGLNPVVQSGVAHLARAGFDRVVVAHADLPLARDLTVVLGPPGVTVVPDRHRDGTNVCSVPTRAGFRFAYGPGSCLRHRVEAHRTRLAWHELDVPDLAWDVDVPADLDLPVPTPLDGESARAQTWPADGHEPDSVSPAP